MFGGESSMNDAASDRMSRVAPTVSIVMSVYNKAKYLSTAIDSVLGQPFPHFEFIIRDNCSTDESAAIVERYADPRIRFSRNSRNLGPVVSANLCIEQAQGDFIAFAHGDDLWEPDFLENSVRIFERFPEAKVSHSLAHNLDAEGWLTKKDVDFLQPETTLISGEEMVRRLLKSSCIIMPTAIVRRDVMRYLDVRFVYSCDWVLWADIAGEGNTFLFINRPLIQYRVTSTSETFVGMRSGEIVFEDYLKLRNFLNKHPSFEKYGRDAFRRLSRSIMRRSRDIADRKTISFFHRMALLCYPWNLVNPGFHLLFFTGLIFGSSGLHCLKSCSRAFSKLFKRK